MAAVAEFVCSQCGAVSDHWSAFCTMCGAPQPEQSAVAAMLAAPASPPGDPTPTTDVAPALALPPMQPGTGFANGAPVVPRAFATLGLGADFAGMQPAHAGRRIAAFTIDAAIVAAVAVAVLVFFGPALAALAALEIAVGLLVWEGNTGRTIGNLLLRLRTTRSDEPRTLGATRAALRGVIVLAGLAVGVLGAWVVVLFSAWDSTGRRQALHDRAAGSVTIRVPAGRGPTTTEWRSAARVPVARAVRSREAIPPPESQPQHNAPLSPPPSAAALFVSLTPVAPVERELTGEQVERAEAMRYISPTVVSTRITVQDVDEDSGVDEPVIAPMPGNAATASAAPTGELLLAFDTGLKATVPIPGTGVIGRTPSTFEPGDRLIAVDDPDRSISRSHVRFRLDADSVSVLDNHSTNGTELLDDEGTATRVPPGEWIDVPGGSRVRMGQRVFTLTSVESSRRTQPRTADHE